MTTPREEIARLIYKTCSGADDSWETANSQDVGLSYETADAVIAALSTEAAVERMARALVVEQAGREFAGHEYENLNPDEIEHWRVAARGVCRALLGTGEAP